MATDKVLSELTPRQTLCLQLVADGLTSKQIGRKLDISHRTVDQHIAAAVEALGMPNRTAASNKFLAWQGNGSTQTAEADGDTSIRDQAGIESIRPDGQNAQYIERGSTGSPLFPPLGGRRNEAKSNLRIRWMATIAAAVFSALALLSMFVLALIWLNDYLT